ncbi:MAG TPA: hypothetical protein VIY48_05150 [Candidatus Paceibacterota bacterium]
MDIPDYLPPVVGRADDFIWRIKKQWSCPHHKEAIHLFKDDPWMEPGELCMDCLTGKWVPWKDEDGWMELTFSEKTSMDRIMEEYMEDIKRELNRETYGGLLKELA